MVCVHSHHLSLFIQFWKSRKATADIEAKSGKHDIEENPNSPIVSCFICVARAARCTEDKVLTRRCCFRFQDYGVSIETCL